MRPPITSPGRGLLCLGRAVIGPVALILLVGSLATACSSGGSRSSEARSSEARSSEARPPTTLPAVPATPSSRQPTTSRSTTATSRGAATTATLPPTTATLPPTTRLPPPTAPTSTVPPTTIQAEQPGWVAVSHRGPAIAVDERTVAGAYGAQVTVFRFRAGQVRFDLHVGSGDPPANLAALPADAQPAVSSAEAPLLLAAFNGGFKVATGTGGFEVDGHTLVPLRTGAASFVIDANGTGHVGVWGQTLPGPGEQVTSVRQDLSPLVLNSQPSPQISYIGDWGATLGGGASVARSSLGEDAAGNILYAGSMSATPAVLAEGLISSGATIAMELDINPEWVQLALAATPGGPLWAGVPGQNRPADQFRAGWSRDFFTVLAAGPGG